MPLYERLLGYAEPKIPVHPFMAAVGEVERGKMTAAQVAAAFVLDAAEQAELATLNAKIKPALEAVSLGGYVLLTNVGAAYDSSEAAKGLGRALIQTAGITRIWVEVYYKKAGTGTITFQLWNETDAAELASVSDPAAAADRVLTMDYRPAQALGKGQKSCRLRVRSTVAADDPSYYGGCLLFERVEKLTEVEVHTVLLLGESGIAPYDSVAAVRARLGV